MLAAAVVLAGCKVATESCTAAADCSEGQVCAAAPGSAGRCCKRTGKEICNGVDDDCNGLIDDGFPIELCNGVDDNCNGQIDETFNLQTSAANCGACGHACDAESACFAGVCKIAGETSCVDGLDNDDDAKIDCADPDCNLKRCGPGCECRAGQKAEGNCTNGLDDDGDGKVDCADENCAGAGCAADGGSGCVCSGLAKFENDCRDGVDNELDSDVDCADSDCLGQLCQAGPSTYRCAPGNTCECNDAGVVVESGLALCRDGIDNDCDGRVDCAEAACNFLPCSDDGGFSCRCLFGGKAETDCADRQDNDGDGTTDCGDSFPDGGGDCPVMTACTLLNGNGVVVPGTCAGDHTCK